MTTTSRGRNFKV